jgi:hypothetical protein
MMIDKTFLFLMLIVVGVVIGLMGLGAWLF